MKIAVMIDGAFLRKKYRAIFKTNISAKDIERFVQRVFERLSLSQDILYRVYFYDCKPCDAKSSLPISHKSYDFERTPQYKNGIALLNDLRKLDYFAVREGQISFSGWKLRKRCYNQTDPYADSDFEPELHQKGVDIKIGLDIAWASYNKIAERIILVTGDSDFVPAIKTARRNGIFVFLFTLKHSVKQDLSNNADVCIFDDLASILKTDMTGC